MNINLPQTILMQAPFGYAYCKLIRNNKDKPIDFEYLEINPAFKKITGIKSKSIRGKKFTELFSDTLANKFNLSSFCKKISAKNGKYEFEYFSESLNNRIKVSAFNIKKDYFITYYTTINKGEDSGRDIKKIENTVNMILENAPQRIFIQTDLKFA